MQNLKWVIGLAPSELQWEELIERLRAERFRVMSELEKFRLTSTSKGPKVVRVKKSQASNVLKKAADLAKVLAKYGVSIEDLEEELSSGTT